jgi:hypothetical protein
MIAFMNSRFAAIDLNFRAVDRRFDEIDRRFDQVDRHLDQVDGRLDRVENRLDRGRVASIASKPTSSIWVHRSAGLIATSKRSPATFSAMTRGPTDDAGALSRSVVR